MPGEKVGATERMAAEIVRPHPEAVPFIQERNKLREENEQLKRRIAELEGELAATRGR